MNEWMNEWMNEKRNNWTEKPNLHGESIAWKKDRKKEEKKERKGKKERKKELKSHELVFTARA